MEGHGGIGQYDCILCPAAFTIQNLPENGGCFFAHDAPTTATITTATTIVHVRMRCII